MGMTWNGDAVMAEIERRAAVAANAVALEILDDAKARCPVRTGQLRDSGQVEHGPDDGSAEVQFTAPYAAEVEMGTMQIAPAAFLRGALYSADKDILARAFNEAGGFRE